MRSPADNVTKRRRIIDINRAGSDADPPRFSTHPATADDTGVGGPVLLSLQISPAADHVPEPGSEQQSVHSDVSAIEPDDLVPLHLLVKPSKKPRQRKHKAPTSAAAVPRSPGGRPISINEYVRSGAG